MRACHRTPSSGWLWRVALISLPATALGVFKYPFPGHDCGKVSESSNTWHDEATRSDQFTLHVDVETAAPGMKVELTWPDETEIFVPNAYNPKVVAGGDGYGNSVTLMLDQITAVQPNFALSGSGSSAYPSTIVCFDPVEDVPDEPEVLPTKFGISRGDCNLGATVSRPNSWSAGEDVHVELHDWVEGREVRITYPHEADLVVKNPQFATLASEDDVAPDGVVFKFELGVPPHPCNCAALLLP